VYGSVRTVVWQGSVGDRRPYADLTGYSELNLCARLRLLTGDMEAAGHEEKVTLTGRQ
jgi:hypothetical protein